MYEYQVCVPTGGEKVGGVLLLNPAQSVKTTWTSLKTSEITWKHLTVVTFTHVKKTPCNPVAINEISPVLLFKFKGPAGVLGNWLFTEN